MATKIEGFGLKIKTAYRIFVELIGDI